MGGFAYILVWRILQRCRDKSFRELSPTCFKKESRGDTNRHPEEEKSTTRTSLKVGSSYLRENDKRTILEPRALKHYPVIGKCQGRLLTRAIFAASSVSHGASRWEDAGIWLTFSWLWKALRHLPWNSAPNQVVVWRPDTVVNKCCLHRQYRIGW